VIGFCDKNSQLERMIVMEMRNLVKEKIEEKGYAIGAFVASSSSMNVEILGVNGFDFAMIDFEHAQTSLETAVDMIRAAELYGVAPYARVYNPKDGPMMGRMLDVGIHGLMVPMINTAEEAEFVIQNTKMPPIGIRGKGTGRGPLWGAYENYNNGEVDEKSMVIVQCETPEAVENIEEIVQVPGIDCVYIGRLDLAHAMGVEDPSSSPELEANIQRVLRACKDAGVIPGIFTAGPEDATNRIEQGFQFVTVLNDLAFFRQATKQRIDAVRQAVEGDEYLVTDAVFLK